MKITIIVIIIMIIFYHSTATATTLANGTLSQNMNFVSPMPV